MTNEEILEKQVEALEKLLQLRSAIIEELEARVDKLETEKTTNQPYTWPYSPPVITTPWINPQPWNPNIQFPGGSGSITITNICSDGSLHTYGPNSGTCTKCGQGLGTITTTGIVTSITDISSSHLWLCTNFGSE